jgi:hypothetical protein
MIMNLAIAQLPSIPLHLYTSIHADNVNVDEALQLGCS